MRYPRSTRPFPPSSADPERCSAEFRSSPSRRLLARPVPAAAETARRPALWRRRSTMVRARERASLDVFPLLVGPATDAADAHHYAALRQGFELPCDVRARDAGNA